MTYPSDELYRHVVGVMGMRRRYEDEAYLEFIRRKACAFCQAQPKSDPHHLAGRGWRQWKRNDLLGVVPLCRSCHTRWHTSGPTRTLGHFRISAADLAVMVSEYLVEYFTRKNVEIDEKPF